MYWQTSINREIIGYVDFHLVGRSLISLWPHIEMLPVAFTDFANFVSRWAAWIACLRIGLCQTFARLAEVYGNATQPHQEGEGNFVLQFLVVKISCSFTSTLLGIVHLHLLLTLDYHHLNQICFSRRKLQETSVSFSLARTCSTHSLKIAIIYITSVICHNGTDLSVGYLPLEKNITVITLLLPKLSCS